MPIGYGDGIRRALTNNCDVLIGGRRYPLVGHGQHGQHHGRAWARPRRGPRAATAVTIIGADGAERQTAEDAGAADRHDQLRDPVRDLRRVPARRTTATGPRRERLGDPLAALGRGRGRAGLAGRRGGPRPAARARPPPTTTWRSTATRARLARGARALRPTRTRSSSRRRSAPGGSWPATAAGRSTCCRCSAGRSRPTWPSATSRSTRSPSRSAADALVDPFGGVERPARAAAADGVRAGVRARSAAVAAARPPGLRARTSRSSRTRRRPAAASAPALAEVAPGAGLRRAQADRDRRPARSPASS